MRFRLSPAAPSALDSAIASKRQRIANLQRVIVAGGATLLVARQLPRSTGATLAQVQDSAARTALLAALQASRRQCINDLGALLRLKYRGEDRRARPR